MNIIMLLQLHCIYFCFIGTHTLCKLHVYCTHKDTKQYLFGLFTLYTCTMYFGERFFKFSFLLDFSNLGDRNEITVCTLKCR